MPREPVINFKTVGKKIAKIKTLNKDIGWGLVIGGFVTSWIAKSGWFFGDSYIFLGLGIVCIIVGLFIAVWGKSNA